MELDSDCTKIMADGERENEIGPDKRVKGKEKDPCSVRLSAVDVFVLDQLGHEPSKILQISPLL
eukprot:scaffold2983_cov152-Skeletonema_menzelii.AAC.6